MSAALDETENYFVLVRMPALSLDCRKAHTLNFRYGSETDLGFKPEIRHPRSCLLAHSPNIRLGGEWTFTSLRLADTLECMKLQTYDLELRETIRKPTPGRCIYCGDDQAKLTDEHVIPYALGGHTAVFEKASCEVCANTIQKYEQRILRGQLGVFRARIDAPTRNRKDRPTHQDLHFVEVDSCGRPIRDLGSRTFSIDDAPLNLSVWELAAPRIIGEMRTEQEHLGRPWASISHSETQSAVAMRLAREVAEETGAKHVAVKVDTINREDFLRFLVKTAHAYAVFEKGLDAFRPLTTDLVLARHSDLAEYVGGGPINPEYESSPASMTELSVGVVKEGPAAGYTAVYIRLYPLLGTPPHVVVVGEPL